jgi:hypothetical protein
MSECLSRILFPLDTTSFLKHYQNREYLHVARNSPSWYDDLLSAGDLDLVLQSEHLPAAFVNVVKDGTRYPLEEWSRIAASARGESRVAVPEKLFDLYSKGATLILNEADRAVPSLSALCRKLTVELGFPAGANVYITPRQAAGFSKHVDDHEVLVLQIAGSKQWLLFVKDAPTVEIGLHPGDLLYLPRGLAHGARAQDGDSIHVTVGLAPIYAYELIRELAALAAEDVAFQQPLPPQFAGETALRTFEAAFLPQVESLILRTKLSDLLDRRFHSLVENQVRGWPGRLSDMRGVQDMTIETIVCRRPGILTEIKAEGKFISVGLTGKRVIVPGFLQGAIAQIMGANAFAIGEIEGFIGSPGKVKLAAEFVKAGLLRIVRL